MKKNITILLVTLLLVNVPGFAQTTMPGTDFQVKGFHLDLRIQVMKMPALKAFAKTLSENGINTLVMEWEATYPFKNQPLIANRFAYTRNEIVDFVDYCSSLGIDVIPLQQSFGHVEYILRHYKYKNIREDQKDYSQVDPLKEDLNRELFTDLYKDIISTHKSQYLHIGGDETYLLGHSPASQKKVAEVGKGRLYGDYLKLLCDIVVSLGKRPVVWADIALKYPDALKLLPKETIFVDWNYGWDINQFGDHKKLMESGYEIWGSPSIRSHPDNYFLSQWEKHFKNIHDFIPMARNFGYKGMVMTSWSTSGIYSTVNESSRDIIDLYAIRRVYPISGFNMLINAYFAALRSTAPLNWNTFISDYASKTYGLNETDATRFWNALKTAPYEVNQGVVSKPSLSITQLLDSARHNASTLRDLKPTRNKTGFEHYRLMADIRVQYLTYQSLEIRANDPATTENEIPAILRELRALQSGSRSLDKRFTALNKDLLYPGEIVYENNLRNAKINLLAERLGRMK